ncbi:inositol monophosphatase [uncultured Desulfuromusa sp.]|uniref:inositol monophosphatase family protein n=1 Tax=uncultured Desulfuromusa sp. TaxID=219183 RepID=UPI002AA64352|nr:inositol monophosphatase [uncultured Desulfuromusa sp.]
MGNYQNLLGIAKRSTTLAGEYLMSGFRTSPELTSFLGDKTRSGMFTEFDKGSNEILITNLAEGFFEEMNDAKVFICSEETGFSVVERKKKTAIDYHQSVSSCAIGENDYTWVIDPICGSIPFARGIADFIVAVSLMKGGETVLGVVYDPVQEEQFFAINGEGAYLNNQLIAPSNISSIEDAYLSIEHKIFRLAPTSDLQKLSSLIRRLRVAGTCGLELAYIACGRLDGLIKLDQPLYDYSAGVIILLEALKRKAGITQLDGVTRIYPHLSLDKNTSFVASNGLVHSAISCITKQWLFDCRTGVKN